MRAAFVATKEQNASEILVLQDVLVVKQKEIECSYEEKGRFQQSIRLLNAKCEEQVDKMQKSTAEIEHLESRLALMKDQLDADEARWRVMNVEKLRIEK